MKLGRAVIIAVAAGVSLLACSPLVHNARSLPWSVGYWYWDGSHSRDCDAEYMSPSVDVLFLLAGRILGSSRSPAMQSAPWPACLHDARRLVLVWRREGSERPPPAFASALVARYRAVKTVAQHHGHTVTGLQIDFDCPTEDLSQYAFFLEAVRGLLPSGDALSATALLDWFRPGTAVQAVTRQLDEFVPQFFDVTPPGLGEGLPAIAYDVCTDQWRERFERQGRPYRIGLATFGRIRRCRQVLSGQTEYRFFRDLDLLNLHALGEIESRGSVATRSGERLATYGVRRANSATVASGDRIEVLLPTAESVGRAYRAARRMGGRCTGVAFFRWPRPGESLVLEPKEVDTAISGRSPVPSPPRIDLADGHCAPLHCRDVRLYVPDRFAATPTRVRLATSAPIAYTIGEPGVRIERYGPRHFDVWLPPLVGRVRTPLGRFFGKQPFGVALVEGLAP